MILHKIRIDNARRWDVAKYDEFIAKNYEDYNDNRSPAITNKKSIKKARRQTQYDSSLNGEQIINEDVSISDFAYSKFRELREMDGITDD